MNVLTCNYERKKKKCARSDNRVKRQESSFTEYSTSWRACRRHLSARMITITLCNGTVLRLRDSMRFCRDNTKQRKRKLMSNSRGFSKLRKN